MTTPWSWRLLRGCGRMPRAAPNRGPPRQASIKTLFLLQLSRRPQVTRPGLSPSSKAAGPKGRPVRRWSCPRRTRVGRPSQRPLPRKRDNRSSHPESMRALAPLRPWSKKCAPRPRRSQPWPPPRQGRTRLRTSLPPQMPGPLWLGPTWPIARRNFPLGWMWWWTCWTSCPLSLRLLARGVGVLSLTRRPFPANRRL